MMKNIQYFITIMTILLALSATATCESVVRELPDTASSGEEITVRLMQDGFLANVVEVTEVLPAGFTYMSGSFTGSHIPTYHAGDNRLIMYLAGGDEVTATYTVTAGTFEQIDNAQFSGAYQGIVGAKEENGPVTGDSELTPVESGVGDIPAPSPTPTATKVIETPTPVETATSVETPTADETPTVTETEPETVTETATAPATETPKKPKGGIPGFEGVFAIAGLMALVLILRRSRNG
jgi:PGF-CTERM protein